MADFGDFAKEALKLITRPTVSFAIWVVCFLLLVVPLPAFLLLDYFRTEYGHWLGVAFLFFFFLWLAEVVVFSWAYVSEKLHTYLDEKKTLKLLDSLNPHEARLLLAAIEKNSQTILFRNVSEGAGSLMAKGLLEMVKDDEREFYAGFRSFIIPRFVWDCLKDDDTIKQLKAKANDKPSSQNATTA